MDKNRFNTVNAALSAVLILSAGLVIGCAAGYFFAIQKSFPEILPVGETNPGIATVKFMEFKNGNLTGVVAGQGARLVWTPEKVVDVNPGDEFKIPVSQINLKEYYAAEDAPPWARFVASSQGKYYYPVFGKRAWSISPSNRVFFPSEKEAKDAGYLKN